MAMYLRHTTSSRLHHSGTHLHPLRSRAPDSFFSATICTTASTSCHTTGTLASDTHAASIVAVSVGTTQPTTAFQNLPNTTPKPVATLSMTNTNESPLHDGQPTAAHAKVPTKTPLPRPNIRVKLQPPPSPHLQFSSAGMKIVAPLFRTHLGIQSFPFFMAYKGSLMVRDEFLLKGFKNYQFLGALAMGIGNFWNIPKGVDYGLVEWPDGLDAASLSPSPTPLADLIHALTDLAKELHVTELAQAAMRTSSKLVADGSRHSVVWGSVPANGVEQGFVEWPDGADKATGVLFDSLQRFFLELHLEDKVIFDPVGML